ncbi:hypothetical protein PIB30_038228 [Stylosanthes scabra]|uniref:Uncharacterized protein n=1 Tax=Stylosanthes scabra TaxID=79078 RepID=A0ABU6UD91_9FABA|nr:hypothetical protein [Stylosanthes scabra]
MAKAISTIQDFLPEVVEDKEVLEEAEMVEVAEIPGNSTQDQPVNFVHFQGYSSSLSQSVYQASQTSRPPPSPSSFHQANSYLTAPSSSVSEASWYPDSGASHHLTNDTSSMISASDYVGPD